MEVMESPLMSEVELKLYNAGSVVDKVWAVLKGVEEAALPV